MASSYPPFMSLLGITAEGFLANTPEDSELVTKPVFIKIVFTWQRLCLLLHLLLLELSILHPLVLVIGQTVHLEVYNYSNTNFLKNFVPVLVTFPMANPRAGTFPRFSGSSESCQTSPESPQLSRDLSSSVHSLASPHFLGACPQYRR